MPNNYLAGCPKSYPLRDPVRGKYFTMTTPNSKYLIKNPIRSKKSSLVSHHESSPPVRVGFFIALRNHGNDELAPSDDLFSDFKKRERELKVQGLDAIKSHNQAWDDVHCEQRFKEQVLKNPSAFQKLREIAKASQTKDIYLICYENPPKKCHRFILLELINKISNALF